MRNVFNFLKWVMYYFLLTVQTRRIFHDRFRVGSSSERRANLRQHHMIGDRRRDRARLTPRLMLILTGCMAVVSGISLIAYEIEPLALYVTPLFLAYCFVLWNIRLHLKPARLPLRRKRR
jgi:hypothetical protein